jgi:hypothetical protein
MRKTIVEHKYPNGARIRVAYVDREAGVPSEDCILLEITSRKRKGLSTTGHFMRPDEALLIASMLTTSVYSITDGYTITDALGKKKERRHAIP